MKKPILILSVLLAIALVSCTSNLEGPGDGGNQDNPMEDLVIADNFNFQTTKLVEISITLPFTVDYTDINSRIEIYDKSPANGGVLLNVGSADDSGFFSKEIRIPSYLTEVFINTFAGSTLLSIDDAQKSSQLKSNTFNFGEGYGTEAPRDTTPETSKTMNIPAEIMEFIGASYGKKTGQNLVTNSTFDTDDFGSQANYNSAMTVDGKWYVTSQLDGYAGQFDDNGENVLRIQKSSARYGGVTQLVSANAGDLITVTGDLKFSSGNQHRRVWLFMIPRNASGQIIRFYNRYIGNKHTDWRTYTVAATMPANTASVQILLWQHIFGGEIYWDNVQALGPVVDADNDGVNDDEDEYPNDASRAYNIYYPNQNDFGSLAFEDNWPGRGDYDFNDLVVNYQFKQIVNANNELVELESKFLFRAIGASLTNGFGFQMEMPSTTISDVRGNSIVGPFAERGGSTDRAFVIVTDNVFTQLPHPGGGTGVNTTPGQTYVTPSMLTVNVDLTTPVPISQIGQPPYNPFIFVDQDRSKEVHLPDYEPTPLANASYFGTHHDDSNAGIGRYYKTENNLPWAIDIPTAFEYPVEKALIVNAYLHFAAWAESSGEQYADWYIDNAGYRNDGNIFEEPQ